MHRILDHAYIFMTVLFTVYSQLIMRWQVSEAGSLPEDLHGKVRFVGTLLLNPWVLTGLVATFFSGVCWLLAMAKFEVSYAFPFVSLNYVLILAASVLLFNEALSLNKLVGTLIVMVGIVVIAKG